MLGYLLGLLGALFQASAWSVVKYKVKSVNQYVLACANFLLVAPFLWIIMSFNEMPELNPVFFLAVAVTALLNIIAVYIYIKALKASPLSLSVPMLAFTPAFLLLTSAIILKEFPSLFGFFGILLIVAGAYSLNYERGNRDLLAPLKAIKRQKGPLYMLGMSFIYSITVNFDKLAVINSSPIFAAAFVTTLIGSSLFIIALVKTKNTLHQFRINFWIFIILGIIISFEILTIYTSFSLINVSYTMSMKRISILFGVLFGYLFFKEKHIKQRLFSAFLMAIGAAVIIIFG